MLSFPAWAGGKLPVPGEAIRLYDPQSPHTLPATEQGGQDDQAFPLKAHSRKWMELHIAEEG